MWRQFVHAIGMDDGKGHLSFNKSITVVLCTVFAVCALRRIEVGWPLLVFGTVIQGAGFGLKGYLAALEKQNTTATVNATTTLSGDLAAITKTVLANRDHERGVDPA